MAHTPGPWTYEESTKTIRSVPTNYWLATMDSWDGAVDHKANAELIARAPELLAALEGRPASRLEQAEYRAADMKATKKAYGWGGMAVGVLLTLAWLSATGCAGKPYFQANAGYNYVDHAGSLDYGEGVATRLEVGLDFGAAECGLYHFSHPFSHQHEAAANGISCGKRWGGAQ